MKIDIKHFALAAAGATMLLTSCIGDLDTLPLNPSDSTSETVYGKDENGYLAGLTKLYFNFVSNDTTDLQVSDGGASELIRAFWTIQEVTADACKCAWENDAWVRAMNTDTWSDADNDATYAVYVRTLQGIAYVNEYLRQTASDKLSDRGVSSELAARIQSFRAEARFLRAYFYWIALDVFGDVPFTTETSPFGGGVNPTWLRTKARCLPHARTTRVPTRVRSTACWPACTSMPRFMPAPRCGRRPNPPAKRSSAWATRSARSIPTSSAATTARTPTP